MKISISFTLLTVLIFAGCEAPALPGADVELSSDEMAKIEEENKEPEPEPLAVDENGVNERATAFTADSPEKGRKSKEAGGYLGAVAHSRFWAEHELFRIQIRKQLDVYNAINDRYPKDFDEFKKEIVVPIGMPLPELPEGQEYIYDPKAKVDEMLKVQPIQ